MPDLGPDEVAYRLDVPRLVLVVAEHRDDADRVCVEPRRIVGDGFEYPVEGEGQRALFVVALASRDATPDGCGRVDRHTYFAHVSGPRRGRPPEDRDDPKAVEATIYRLHRRLRRLGGNPSLVLFAPPTGAAAATYALVCRPERVAPHASDG